jgi:hypothetical protein
MFKDTIIKDDKIRLDDFYIHKVLGLGGFGRVFHVQNI